MLMESRISHRDELSIEPPLIGPGLVARGQKNGSSYWIKCKAHSPCAAVRVEAKLLHSCVAGTFQCIDERSSQPWPFLFQKQSSGEYRVLDGLWHRIELRPEIRMK